MMRRIDTSDWADDDLQFFKFRDARFKIKKPTLKTKILYKGGFRW